MDLKAGLVQYPIAVAVFCVVDYVWLKFVAVSLYRDLLGDLLADKPRVGAAVVFYAIFLLGLVVFVIHPAAEQDSMDARPCSAPSSVWSPTRRGT